MAFLGSSHKDDFTREIGNGGFATGLPGPGSPPSHGICREAVPTLLPSKEMPDSEKTVEHKSREVEVGCIRAGGVSLLFRHHCDLTLWVQILCPSLIIDNIVRVLEHTSLHG